MLRHSVQEAAGPNKLVSLQTQARSRGALDGAVVTSERIILLSGHLVVRRTTRVDCLFVAMPTDNQLLLVVDTPKSVRCC